MDFYSLCDPAILFPQLLASIVNRILSTPCTFYTPRGSRGGKRKQRAINTIIGHRPPVVQNNHSRPPSTLTTIKTQTLPMQNKQLSQKGVITDYRCVKQKYKQTIKCVDFRRPTLPTRPTRVCEVKNLTIINTQPNANLDAINYTTTNELNNCHTPATNTNKIDNTFTGARKTQQNIRHHGILYFNARSVRNKTTQINDLITESSAGIALITETWLSIEGDEVAIKEITPNGYKCASYPRTSGRKGGGICIIYKEEIDVKIEQVNTFSTFECVKATALNTTFVCLYYPPPSSKTTNSRRDFVNHMNDLLEACNCDHKNFIILGDFNLHFDSATDTYTQSMKSVLDNYHLKQLVDTPTHEKGHIIDWLITNADESTINNLEVTDKLISDHFVISFSITAQFVEPKMRTALSRNIKAININAFDDSLKTAVRSMSTQEDHLADVFNSKITEVLDQHAPLRTRTIRKRPSAPWLTSKVMLAKQKRRAAERRWNKTNLEIDKQSYRNEIKSVQDCIVNEKRNYYNDKISKCKNSKVLFDIVNEMKGNTQSSQLPSNIPIKELPNTFSNYFTNKVEKIRSSLDSSSLSASNNESIDAYSGLCFCTFREVSVSEVKKLMLSSPAKSCPLDPIPTNLLVRCIDTLAEPITQIINHSLQTGAFPDCYKKAIVIPLLKKLNLDLDDLKNYRPVSNLSFISKILEKIVLIQLKEHLHLNNLMEPFQSAYRGNHSTESALLKITNDILSSIDNGHVSFLTLLDLSAAFDTIDHSILIDRLHHSFGISESVLSWFRSYLTDRSQAIIIDGTLSEYTVLKFGVPQGSVLGPILYTLYTLPLGKVISANSINYHMYADDTQLYKSAPPSEIFSLSKEFENCSNSIKVWMTANKLQLNEEKTEVLLCSSDFNTKKSAHAPSIKVANKDILLQSKAKNLGVILDPALSMTHHINHMVKLMNLELRRICRIKSFLTQDSIKQVVSALILSRLDYCNSLLAGLPEVRLSKLQRVQNNAAKLVLNRGKYDSSSELLKILHWLPVKARIEYKIALFCFNTVNNTAPKYLKDLIHPYEPSRSLRSGGSKLLVVPRSKLRRYGDRSFRKIGPETWNALPSSVRHASSINIFKQLLKTHLFNKYFA